MMIQRTGLWQSMQTRDTVLHASEIIADVMESDVAFHAVTLPNLLSQRTRRTSTARQGLWLRDSLPGSGAGSEEQQ